MHSSWRSKARSLLLVLLVATGLFSVGWAVYVNNIQGRPIVEVAPTDGQSVIYSNTNRNWYYGNPPGGIPGGTAGGGLSGTYPNPSLNSNAAVISIAPGTAMSMNGSTGNVTANVVLGGNSNSACAGNDARLSDSRPPIGSAGNALGGTYPNPYLATDSVTDTHILNNTITYGKIQQVSAADRILGSTTGAGNITEIPCTATARSLLDDSSISAIRQTLEFPAALVVGGDTSKFLNAALLLATPSVTQTGTDGIKINSAQTAETGAMFSFAVYYDTAGLAIDTGKLTLTTDVVFKTYVQTLTSKTINDMSNYVDADAIHVKVFAATTVTKGQAVYISAWNVANGCPEVLLADSDAAATMPAIGLAEASIAENAVGEVRVSGTLAGLNTNTFSSGVPLFVSGTAGALTATEPTAAAKIQRIAIVGQQSATAGTVTIVGAGRTNEFPNFSAADRYPYGGTGGVKTEGTITATGRSILDDASVSAVRQTLEFPADLTTDNGDTSKFLNGDLLLATPGVTLTGGDVTGSGSTFAANISLGAVTYAKIQNVSAGNVVLGRVTGAGPVEEIACTATGRSILDDTAVSDVITTLGGFGTGPGSIAQGSDVRFPAAPASAGRMLYDTGAAWAAVTAGTSSQVLIGGAAPAFGAVPEAMQTLADNTTNDASTTYHGYVPKLTAPAAGLLNVYGIANAETALTAKALFDATNPADLGTAAPGSAMAAARRDHVHAKATEATLTLADNTTNDASTTMHGFVPKLTAPASGLLNVYGIGNGETALTAKAIFDTTNPANLGTVSPGTQVIAARRDHVHEISNLQTDGMVNRLINPSGAINQRASASSSDGTYAVDRWYVLTQTGTVTVSIVSDPEAGTAECVHLTQSQANAQRMGLCQVIERKNCVDLRSAAMAAIGRVACSASQPIRFAICEWTGTADAVTKDIVADWTSATYTTAGFFTSTSMVVTAVGSVTPGAATWTDLPTITGTANAGMNNVFVFIWTEGTAAQNVTLDIARVQLVKGTVAPQYLARAYAEELRLCQRYYQKSYADGTAPGTDTATGIWASNVFAASVAIPTTQSYAYVTLPVEMRSTPTFKFYSKLGTADRSSANDDSDFAANSALPWGTGPKGSGIYNNSGGDITSSWTIKAHYTATAEL
jgi:hypothetical protein